MIYTLFLYFIIYAFFGWIIEVLYCSLIDKKITNRGFLYGPFCPIYGFGSLSIIYFLSFASFNFFILFILSIIITSILEYITSFLMEKTFGFSWWDYKNKPVNLNGRICLQNSVIFGLLAVTLIYVIHPFFVTATNNIPLSTKTLLFICIFSILLIDSIVSIFEALHLSKLISEQKEKIAVLLTGVKIKMHEKYSGKWSKYVVFHFNRHFPNLKSIKHKISLARLKKYFINIRK